MIPFIVAGLAAGATIYGGIQSNRSLAKSAQANYAMTLQNLASNYNRLKQQGQELSAQARLEASNVYRESSRQIATIIASSATGGLSGATIMARATNAKLQGEIQAGSVLAKGNAGLVEIGYQSENAYEQASASLKATEQQVKANMRSPLSLAVSGLTAGVSAYSGAKALMGAAATTTAVSGAGATASAQTTTLTPLQNQYFSANLGFN